MSLTKKLGVAAYWLSLPLLRIYVHGTKRTRVLLVAADKVLLIRAWHGLEEWSLPGGGVHKHEEPVNSATRELYEETTVALGIDQLKPLFEGPYGRHGIKFRCYYFVGTLKKPIRAKARLPEVMEVRWVSLRELSKYQLAPDAEAAVRAWQAQA